MKRNAKLKRVAALVLTLICEKGHQGRDGRSIIDLGVHKHPVETVIQKFPGLLNHIFDMVDRFSFAENVEL